MIKIQEKVQSLVNLWWFDREERKYFPAGVAFYDDKCGEYRLKININPETCYYLRPIESIEGKRLYLVEVAIKNGEQN